MTQIEEITEITSKVINTFRMDKVKFTLDDFVEKSNLPKVKSKYILGGLSSDGFIRCRDGHYSVVDYSTPIYLNVIKNIVERTISSYNATQEKNKQQKELKAKRNKKEDYSIQLKTKHEDNFTLTEEMCVNFLKETGKYKIYKFIEL